MSNIEDIEDEIDTGEATLDLYLPEVVIAQPPGHTKIFLPGDSYVSCNYGKHGLGDECGGYTFRVGVWNAEKKGYNLSSSIWCEKHLPLLRDAICLPDL